MTFKDMFQNLEGKLKNSPNRGSFYILNKEVIDTGLCIKCGTCVSVCEYNALSWNSVLKQPELGGGEATGHCVACGVCYHSCPKSFASEKKMIGNYLKPYILQSNDFHSTSQDGGTTTLLLSHLFEQNLIEAAILTRSSTESQWVPEAQIVTSKEGLSTFSGSIYAHSQVSSKLVEAVRQGFKKIAVVGCPCKSESIALLKNSPEGVLANFEDLQIYNIGLFCMEAFIPDKLHTILEGKDLNLSKISKMDFSGGKFRIYEQENGVNVEKETFAISALHDAIETSCHTCTDFTAEYADISIGSVGAPAEFNMVLARTPEMVSIVESFIASGKVQSIAVENSNIRSLVKIAQNKKENRYCELSGKKEFDPEAFRHHEPKEWNANLFNYSAEVHQEEYKSLKFTESELQSGEGEPVFIAKTPVGSKMEITQSQYASSFDLTMKLLQKEPKIKGGKVLIKPNNTGFVGIFKNDVLKDVLDKNGITDDADHQPIATQPAMLAGMVDALLELGAKQIDIGENMLWDGGTPRAFFETGYATIFSDRKYRNKVYFIDFYEDDPPTNTLEKVPLEKTAYCEGDYYNTCYPPKALFSEKYDYILIASVAKSHNCAFYTLSNKNFSVSWNPRKKTGKIEPRWHIHGVPLEIFNPKRIKKILGKDFKRKNKIYVRDVYKHKWHFTDKQQVVKPAKSQIVLSNQFMSGALLNHFKSFNNEVLDVDPHHWSGINIGLLTLGMGYLINRYTRIFGAVVNKLSAQGTKVGAIVSGIAGQEGDGPLIYGNTKYAGFSAASFDHVALERLLCDMMYGIGAGGYAEYLIDRQKQRMDLHKIDSPELLDAPKDLWTFRIMHDLIGGNNDLKKIPVTILNYTQDSSFNSLKVEEMYKLRDGAPFLSSLGYYCDPDLWLKLLHNNESLYLQMFLIERGSIEIPLIPGVVG